jgi:hypothetical protein
MFATRYGEAVQRSLDGRRPLNNHWPRFCRCMLSLSGQVGQVYRLAEARYTTSVCASPPAAFFVGVVVLPA